MDSEKISLEGTGLSDSVRRLRATYKSTWPWYMSFGGFFCRPGGQLPSYCPEKSTTCDFPGVKLYVDPVPQGTHNGLAVFFGNSSFYSNSAVDFSQKSTMGGFES